MHVHGLGQQPGLLGAGDEPRSLLADLLGRAHRKPRLLHDRHWQQVDRRDGLGHRLQQQRIRLERLGGDPPAGQEGRDHRAGVARPGDAAGLRHAEGQRAARAVRECGEPQQLTGLPHLCGRVAGHADDQLFVLRYDHRGGVLVGPAVGVEPGAQDMQARDRGGSERG
ncbi:MAG: hypothetical protein D3X82_05405 [Candidatus Leucobacter sulfamidivorax]|nr:hypothetical protein [Candidatus Leucobacter sulfamidivorax]